MDAKNEVKIAQELEAARQVRIDSQYESVRARLGIPANDRRMPWEPNPDWKWKVRYYDPKKSGIQVMRFNDLNKAEEFASKNRIYAKPCKVEEI